jgi:hypothetical protein
MDDLRVVDASVINSMNNIRMIDTSTNMVTSNTISQSTNESYASMLARNNGFTRREENPYVRDSSGSSFDQETSPRRSPRQGILHGGSLPRTPVSPTTPARVLSPVAYQAIASSNTHALLNASASEQVDIRHSQTSTKMTTSSNAYSATAQDGSLQLGLQCVLLTASCE